MNYTTKVGVPSAHLTKKKSRLKVYNGHNVFLNDGDNFEFELYNPKNKSVLAKIKLNGDYISNSGIILKPGQRVFLERFLDSNNKFVYSTYSVEDNDENRTAIALNGDVRIEFYDQENFVFNPYLGSCSYTTTWNGSLSNNTASPYYGNMTFTTSNSSLVSAGINTTSNTMFVNGSLETGRVEKGESSSQNFTQSNENFSYAVSKYYDFKILPLSHKNKTVEEIRHYCTECGTKVKQKYKFCPSCGNKI